MMDCQHIRTAIETASRFEPIGETAQRHLRSCDGCREYADEMSNFLSLLKSVPRVTAPADFDFRLRARIAQAQAKRRSPFSFLEGFWSLSFSWGQTATAMATVALVATLATFYFIRQTPTSPIGVGDIANVTPAPKVELPKSSVTTSLSGPQPAITNTIAAVSPASTTRVKGGMRSAGGNRPEQSESANGEQIMTAGAQVILVSQPRGGAPRMVALPVATYGAQRVVNRAENTVAANQAIF